jgi:hypothetical protein
MLETINCHEEHSLFFAVPILSEQCRGVLGECYYFNVKSCIRVEVYRHLEEVHCFHIRGRESF